MKGKKLVLVCGGRSYADRDRVFAELDRLNLSAIVHGGAKGADQLATDYAIARNLPTYVHHAQWWRYGAGAGPIRNQDMIDSHPDLDLVLAFPGGRGTADMVRRARRASVEVKEIS